MMRLVSSREQFLPQEFGPRLRQFRRDRGLNQTELAAKANINQGFLSGLERGIRNPSHNTVRALAVALNVPEAVLIGQGPEHDAPQPLDTRDLPMLNRVPCGPPAESQEQLEMFPVLRHLWAPDRYCLKLTYDSMEPTLKPDDIVLVQYRPEVNPEHVQGRICACLVDGQPTLKRISVERRGGERVIVLRGDNPDSRTILVDASQDFSIQWIVIKLVSREL